MSHSLLVPLDPTSRSPMHRQLSDAIRDAIVRERLKAGTRLPSTRALGHDLRVSRNTVLEAFSQLRAEGYLESRTGSGTYVASRLPERTMAVSRRPVRQPPSAEPSPARLSQRASILRTTSTACTHFNGARLPFAPSTPAEELFPAATWRRLMTHRWAQHPDPSLQHSGAGGHAPLREAISEYVCMSRGITCDPAQVIVLGEECRGIDLAARVLVDPADRVWFEDPGSPRVRNILTLAGAEVVPVPVDRDGIDVSAGVEAAPDARMAYVTPSAQYPLVCTMSQARRTALLEWARSRSAWILEDDRDSEFRYSSRPLPALYGLDTNQRVIYLGSFSRILAPAMRVAFLVVPSGLVDVFAAAASLTDGDVPAIEQAVLADFLAGGHFVRHLRRLRAAYEHRRGVLLERLEARAPDLLRIAIAPAGMHVVAHLPAELSDQNISQRCTAVKLVAPALSDHATGRTDLNGLLLGFAGYSDPAIRYGAKRLADVLHSACDELRQSHPTPLALAA